MRAVVAVLASALLNAGALRLLERAGAFQVPRPREEMRVALAPIARPRWEANRAIAREARPTTPARQDRAADGSMPSRPVVEVAPSPDARRPDRARFLADRDNTVPRDVQLAGKVPPRSGAILARPTAGRSDAQGIPAPGEDGRAERSAPGREGSGEDAASRARIAAARQALAPGGELASAPRAGGDGGARRTGRFDPRVLPPGPGYAEPGSGGPTDDPLPGVAAGDATMLNTWGFRYSDFFRRVHDAIKAEWDPNRAWDAHDPSDRLLGRSTRRVLLDIVLDAAGRLRDVTVVRGSGLDFFDRECLRAIRAASPFPNPPRGLVNGQGLVVLRRYGLAFRWPRDGALGELHRLAPGGGG